MIPGIGYFVYIVSTWMHMAWCCSISSADHIEDFPAMNWYNFSVSFLDINVEKKGSEFVGWTLSL